jgi:hypothetical protein
VEEDQQGRGQGLRQGPPAFGELGPTHSHRDRRPLWRDRPRGPQARQHDQIIQGEQRGSRARSCPEEGTEPKLAGRRTGSTRLLDLREGGRGRTQGVEGQPKNSSKECIACGHTEAANRCRSRFICTRCRHEEHADVNAAQVITARGQVAETSWRAAGCPVATRPVPRNRRRQATESSSSTGPGRLLTQKSRERAISIATDPYPAGSRA